MPSCKPNKIIYGLMLSLSLALAGCGGSDDDSDVAAPEPAPPTPPVVSIAPKVLMVGVDGMTYSALQSGRADGKLANLRSLTLTRAWTGGVTGTTSQQATLALPGWASLLTGTWANRHQVRSDATQQTPHSATVFEQARAARSAIKSAGATSSPALASLLGADRDAGHLDQLTDCAQTDPCVTDETLKRIDEGYDLVFAQYAAPLRAASQGGFGGTYADSLVRTDADIGKLLAAVDKRRVAHPGENWLVLVSASSGLSVIGSQDGLPLPANKTIFIASNVQPLLGGDDSPLPADAAWNPQWEALPGATDFTPTALAHLNALGAPDAYPRDGAALTLAGGLRRFSALTAQDRKSVALSWIVLGQPAANIRVLREGQLIATLPGDATAFVDDTFAFDTDGLHTLNYQIATDTLTLSSQTTVLYTQPVVLNPNIRVGLGVLHTFEGNLADSGGQGLSTLVPFDGSQLPTFVPDGVFGQAFRNMRSDKPVGGFKLEYPKGALDSLQQFTFGFWYRSNGMSDDKPILSNKDYNTGGNPGITIAQWNTSRPNYVPEQAELRFNIGGGGARADLNGFGFTPNRWVYVVLAIDKTARTMTAGVYDPVKGFSSRSLSTGSVDLSLISGVFGPHITLNEDGRGSYDIDGSYERGPYTMDFDDLAFWTRALSEDEMKSIALSGKSLSQLLR